MGYLSKAEEPRMCVPPRLEDPETVNCYDAGGVQILIRVQSKQAVALVS